MQQPVTPHVDLQSEFPPPASSADDDPMPLPHVEDTPPWVYQEPETPCISTEQDTPVTIQQQVPLPPIQIPPSREETNMSTGDSIIPPPPWFDETPQPASTIHEDVLPPVPSFDETPFVTVPVPETPTIPSVAKRWRSDVLHLVAEIPTIPSVAKRWRSGTLPLENPVSKRWRSDTLHPENPCSDHNASTTSVARRCFACFASISKTPRHTIRSLGTCETISIGSGSSDDDSRGETL